MGEFIKSLAMSAQNGLSYLHIAHLRVNSNANAEALGKLLCQQASSLQSLSLEQIFGKKKLFELTFASLSAMRSSDTLQDFACKQADMTDKQTLFIAKALS